MTLKTNLKHPFLLRITVLAAVWLASYGGIYRVLEYFNFADKNFSNLMVNTVFLLASFGCIRLFRLSAKEVGLMIIQPRVKLHVTLCGAILTMYYVYYLLVVRISNVRPFSYATLWGVINYLIVAAAEEIYFRGIFYNMVEQRYSGRVAVLVSGLLFGFIHFHQGLGMLPKFFSGWLWGGVRYATGMITMLIFPVHFTYNAVWLLFEGNWDDPSKLAYLLPLMELLACTLLMFLFKDCIYKRKLGNLQT